MDKLTYAYAGFQYEIIQLDNGKFSATPLPGQHPAAAKEKHRRAALENFIEDFRR